MFPLTQAGRLPVDDWRWCEEWGELTEIHSTLRERYVLSAGSLSTDRGTCRRVPDRGERESAPSSQGNEAEVRCPRDRLPPLMQRYRRLERESASTIEKGHGRIDCRTLTSTTVLSGDLNRPMPRFFCN